MAVGIKTKGAERITHFGAVRLRVTGVGNLDMRMLSIDEVKTVTLTPLAMSATTNIEPTKLTNFVQQRAMLEGKTTEIDETFVIQRIIVFVKPIYESYPS